jgi:hypothetical protein
MGQLPQYEHADLGLVDDDDTEDLRKRKAPAATEARREPNPTPRKERLMARVTLDHIIMDARRPTVSDEYTGDVIRVGINETREGDRTHIWATVHDAADDPLVDDAQWEIALSPAGATRLAQRLLGAADILYELDGCLCPDCQTPEENAEAAINEATLEYGVSVDGRLLGRPKSP